MDESPLIGVRVELDGRPRVPGVRPLVYHCEVVPPGGLSAVVFDVCHLSTDALDVAPLPARVTSDGLVAVPAFGLGHEPLHVVAYADGGGPSLVSSEATLLLDQRPIAGTEIVVGGSGCLIRVLRVEELHPPCTATALHGLARRTGLSLGPAGGDPPKVPRPPLPCRGFHRDGPAPLASPEGVRRIVDAWTVELDARCANSELRADIAAILPSAAALAEPFVSRRVCVSEAVKRRGAIPPARASAGTCVISFDDAAELGGKEWALHRVPGHPKPSHFAYVSTGALVAVVDTHEPARFPVALHGADLPPRWLHNRDNLASDARDALPYVRACVQYRAAVFPSPVH